MEDDPEVSNSFNLGLLFDDDHLRTADSVYTTNDSLERESSELSRTRSAEDLRGNVGERRGIAIGGCYAYASENNLQEEGAYSIIRSQRLHQRTYGGGVDERKPPRDDYKNYNSQARTNVLYPYRATREVDDLRLKVQQLTDILNNKEQILQKILKAKDTLQTKVKVIGRSKADENRKLQSKILDLQAKLRTEIEVNETLRNQQQKREPLQNDHGVTEDATWIPGLNQDQARILKRRLKEQKKQITELQKEILTLRTMVQASKFPDEFYLPRQAVLEPIENHSEQGLKAGKEKGQGKRGVEEEVGRDVERRMYEDIVGSHRRLLEEVIRLRAAGNGSENIRQDLKEMRQQLAASRERVRQLELQLATISRQNAATNNRPTSTRYVYDGRDDWSSVSGSRSRSRHHENCIPLDSRPAWDISPPRMKTFSQNLV